MTDKLGSGRSAFHTWTPLPPLGADMRQVFRLPRPWQPISATSSKATIYSICLSIYPDTHRGHKRLDREETRGREYIEGFVGLVRSNANASAVGLGCYADELVNAEAAPTGCQRTSWRRWCCYTRRRMRRAGAGRTCRCHAPPGSTEFSTSIVLALKNSSYNQGDRMGSRVSY